MTSKKHVFTPIEKNIFTDILRKFKGVIENKETDGSTLRAKNEAWDSIRRLYNSSRHVTSQVTSKQLRRLWMNMRQRQREALTKKRQHRIATGGPSTSDAVIHPNISAMPALLVGIERAIDSETLPISTQEIPAFTSTPESDPIPVPSHVIDPQTTSRGIPPTNRQYTPSPPPTPYPPSQMIPPSPSSASFHHQKTILDKEYQDRKTRADQIYDLEVELLREKIKEAKAKTREAEAKADLAELMLRQQSVRML